MGKGSMQGTDSGCFGFSIEIGSMDESTGVHIKEYRQMLWKEYFGNHHGDIAIIQYLLKLPPPFFEDRCGEIGDDLELRGKVVAI